MLEQILSGNRRALSQAITLVESDNSKDQLEAKLLLEKLVLHRKNSLRVGISGPPGVGKSTLIESLGLYLLEHEERAKKLAILSVDPSSQISGGSVLGDKTRMQGLAQDERVFIRPSPSRGHLGGVTLHSEETMLLCEAAGFDLVLLESVGVGQSESDISSLVDILVLVLPPAAGDELQGIKKGLFELADLIVINKSDGVLKKQADIASKSYQNALHLMGRNTPVVCVSALEHSGMNMLWDKIIAFENLAPKQSYQLQQRFWNLAQQKLLADFKSNPKVRAELPDLLNQVRSRKITAWQALSHFFLVTLLCLGSCSPEKRTQELITQLESKNTQKAYQALIKLTQIADPKALDAVIAYSEGKAPPIQIQAILAARQFKSRKALPWLFVLSTGHPDENVRNAASEAFSCLDK
ncbi:MAG: methylmalonyl Co-A mutase-associated GTPase MeaB [Myxococcaceae bacterium]